MKHTRRGFFATLIAAAAAPLFAKLKAKSADHIPLDPVKVAEMWSSPELRDHIMWNSMRQGSHMFYYDPSIPMLEFWPKPYPQELQDAVNLLQFFECKRREAIQTRLDSGWRPDPATEIPKRYLKAFPESWNGQTTQKDFEKALAIFRSSDQSRLRVVSDSQPL